MRQGCAAETARAGASFEQALAEGPIPYSTLCGQVGAPAWVTGSGLMILIYPLDDGAEIRFGYGGLDHLRYARLIRNNQIVDLLADP